MTANNELNLEPNVDTIIEQGLTLLSNHQWAKAARCFDQAIEIAPENPYSYLGRLLASHKLSNIDSLRTDPKPFSDNDYFQKALYFSNDELYRLLIDYDFASGENRKNAKEEAKKIAEDKKKKDIYNKATDILITAKTESHYQEIISLLTPIQDWEDSKIIINNCHKHIEELKQQEAQLNSLPNIIKGNLGAFVISLAIIIAMLVIFPKRSTLFIILIFASLIISFFVLKASNIDPHNHMKIFLILLILATLLTLIIAMFSYISGEISLSSSGGSYSCGHDSCEQYGPFNCYGKNNTCNNKTYCAYDLYCDACD